MFIIFKRPDDKMKNYFFILFFLFNQHVMAQEIDSTLIEGILKDHPDQFASILNHPEKKQVQILYTQISRDRNNRPSFKTYSYNLDSHRYFYPASTVKLAAVIFALEKINELNMEGLSARSTMITDSSSTGQTKVLQDTSSENGLPSIEHYIRKILLTSDNDAFNRLFEFIGRKEINTKLKKYGFTTSRILNRLAINDGRESSKRTNPIRFYNGNALVYSQPMQFDPNEYPLRLTNTVMGIGYIDSAEHLVMKPFSLENKNAFSISDQQLMMRKLMFPEAYPKEEQFNLTTQDYMLIYRYMSMLPTESHYPKYDMKEFWPAYAKMLYYGREKTAMLDPNIRIFNKYGDSYGFIIDNSYFVDFQNKIEYFLTAVIQSNENKIYNDGKYEYESVCYPFLKNLGRAIYNYEMLREKPIKPDLSKFRFKY